MRIPIVAGNWKCHKTTRDTLEFLRELLPQLEEVEGIEVVVCPPFTALSTAAGRLSGSTIALGAQDLFWEPQGAYTGEVSAPMLIDVGCRYGIIGHSERRGHFQETDEQIQKKLTAALANNITPILCIGETLQQREANQTFEVLLRQLTGALENVTVHDAHRLVIAYEPVWAIGTGRNATPSQAQEAHLFIRQQLAARWTTDAAERIRIQYGGSVTTSNAAELLQQSDIDGALVGGASLKAESFAAIVKSAAAAKLVSR